jgi:bifunctional DNase/RNase
MDIKRSIRLNKCLAYFSFFFLISYASLGQTGPASKQNRQERQIQMRVENIQDYSSGSFALLLVNVANPSGRNLTMIIGDCEASAIARTLSGIESPRPLTYPLIGSLFERTSLSLNSVCITKLENGTFYAELHIDDNGKEVRIDSRPSDAINIALVTNVPIYTYQSVIDAANQ